MNIASPARLRAVLVGNGLLRVANAAGGALVGFYLAALAKEGGGMDATLLGGLGAVVNGTELIAAVPVGLLSDRYSPRTILVIGCVLGALATQLFGLTSLIAIFFLSRALEGVASAAGGPALLAHLTDATEGAPEQRGRVMGLYELALLAGLALGTLVGGDLWARAGTGAALRAAPGLCSAVAGHRRWSAPCHRWHRLRRGPCSASRGCCRAPTARRSGSSRWCHVRPT